MTGEPSVLQFIVVTCGVILGISFAFKMGISAKQRADIPAPKSENDTTDIFMLRGALVDFNATNGTFVLDRPNPYPGETRPQRFFIHFDEATSFLSNTLRTSPSSGIAAAGQPLSSADVGAVASISPYVATEVESSPGPLNTHLVYLVSN